MTNGTSATAFSPSATATREEAAAWYEDARSVTKKLRLARLFGVTGVSLWHIGIIPDYAGVYDVWSVVG